MSEHIFCRGRARGFTHEVFELGWRIAEAHYRADYYFRWHKAPRPEQGVLL